MRNAAVFKSAQTKEVTTINASFTFLYFILLRHTSDVLRAKTEQVSFLNKQ